MKKAEVLELLREMPEDIDPEELMYRLYLKVKLSTAEEAVRQGDVVSHAEVVRQTEEWLR